MNNSLGKYVFVVPYTYYKSYAFLKEEKEKKKNERREFLVLNSGLGKPGRSHGNVEESDPKVPDQEVLDPNGSDHHDVPDQTKKVLDPT